ncbi:hypothetical protein BGZ95_010520 [Linnemannia exigua]|uniref:Ser-Thr-rich glycosyl-phosphatidyl-inositol-anchored membrane family-domain-containing protein n=1 Tax=Linnemannia exigua TaxID=604196 RepID=A0AAD4DKF9_9FUNG|nr:hypothetical protein BGZ95_010520 [Linnemannia exigua]
MLAKTIIAATLALAATVSAQTPNHIYFTYPISKAGDSSQIMEAGKNITFSWSTPCNAGEWISPNPTAVSVQLVNANNAEAVGFVSEVTKIDCTGNSGNNYWVPPAEYANDGNVYSLRMQIGAHDVYSGNFKIGSKNAPVKPSGSAPGTSTPSNTPAAGNAGNILTPVLSGAAAIAAGALMFL